MESDARLATKFMAFFMCVYTKGYCDCWALAAIKDASLSLLAKTRQPLESQVAPVCMDALGPGVGIQRKCVGVAFGSSPVREAHSARAAENQAAVAVSMSQLLSKSSSGGA